jgi:hypothetical protein
MQNESELFRNSLPRIGGHHIRVKKTGEIVEWQSFDPKDQVFQFRSSTGELCSVRQRDTEIATDDEVLEYLKKRISN